MGHPVDISESNAYVPPAELCLEVRGTSAFSNVGAPALRQTPGTPPEVYQGWGMIQFDQSGSRDHI